MVTRFQDKAIHYTVHGQGKALVLLHGFLESKEMWEEFIPGFSESKKVIAIDLPGHGNSEVFSQVHSMELMAKGVHAVLAQLGVEEASFIGHSMGGYVALAFLELFPEEITGITLLNSTPEADTKEKIRVRERSVQLVNKNKEAYVSMAISNLLADTNSNRFPDEIKVLKQRARKFPVGGITAALEGMKIRTEKKSILKRFQGSKNIITGKKDPLIPYNTIKSIADHCNCRFFTLPGGHLSYIESKEELKKLCISSKKSTF